MNTRVWMGRSALFLALGMVLLWSGVSHAMDVDKVNFESFAMWNAAMAKGDFDKAASFLAEDGVRLHPVAGEIKGRKAMRDFFEALAKDWGDQKCTVTWHNGNGDKAATAFTWEATQKSTGKKVKLPILLVSTYDAQGKAVWQQEIFDTAAFAKQLE